jgi:hypothetical protein
MKAKQIYTVTMRIIILLSIFASVFTACVSEENIIGEDDGMAHETQVSFSLMFTSDMQMRTSFSEADESAIQTVHILMFNKTTGNKTYAYGVSGKNIRTVSSVEKTFDAKLPVGSYDLVILANAQHIIEKSNIAVGESMENVLNALVETTSGKWSGSAIPMWGRMDDVNISSASGMNKNQTIEMIRMMARIDVEVAASAAANFKLTDIWLYNRSTQGALVPDMNSWPANNMAVAPSRPAASGGYSVASTPLVYDAADGVTAGECRRIIYTYEAPAGAIGGNMSGNTCLVIGGKYNNGTVSYYRVEFAAVNAGQTVFLPLLRNCAYLVRISSVSNNGYATPDLAFASQPANMDASTLIWNGKGMNNIIFDGKYMLGVSAYKVTMPADAYAEKGLINKIMVMTTAPSGCTIDIANNIDAAGDAWAWLSQYTFNTPGVAKEIYVYTKKNTTSSERKAQINITAQQLTCRIEIIQGTSSGFGIEIIDAVTGMEISTLDFSYTAGETKGFKVVWMPATAKITVNVAAVGNDFAGSGLPTDNTVLTGGLAAYSVTGNSSAIDRITRLDFTLSTGVAMEMKTLYVRQKQ